VYLELDSIKDYNCFFVIQYISKYYGVFLKTVFLDALIQLDEVPEYKVAGNLDLHFLKALKGYSGLFIRLYTGDYDMPWQNMKFHSAEHLPDIDQLELPTENLPDTAYDYLHFNFNQTNYSFALSPFITDNSMLGQIMLIFNSASDSELIEWHLFADQFAGRICSKFRFPGHLRAVHNVQSDRLLSFLHETQNILNISREVDALPPGNEKRQAQIWFKEDSPIISSFLNLLQREFGLYAAFIVQHAGPGFFHQISTIACDESQEAPESIQEIMNDAMCHEHSQGPNHVTRAVIKSGSNDYLNNSNSPVLFACQAGGHTYGHLGMLISGHDFNRHLNRQAKLMPMVANQLGLYFSHLFQLRKEALHGRMLQQINQTCNTINSSVDIAAILFKLIESLNYLFGQYSGAILTFARDTSELEIVNYLGAEIPSGLDMNELINTKSPVVEAINEGSAFDNRDERYPLPIRYVLPLATTPQASAISSDFVPLRALGGVVLFKSPHNKSLSEEDLTKLMPILLNGVSASLQVACNYAEKLDTIRALEGMMERLSDTDALLDEMVVIIRRLLKVNRISFLEVDESGQYLYIKKGYGLPEDLTENTRIPIGEEISGYVALKGKPYRIDNIESEGIFKKRSKEQYLNRSLLSVPLINPRASNDRKVIGVINVNNKTNGLTFTLQDQQLLEAIAHLVVTALENVRYMEEQHEKDLLERQLNDARDIQMSLMPKSFSDFPGSLDLFGKSIPARQIGGDFFDILTLDDGRILSVLGDVSGKGMSAAILMAVARMIIRSVVQDISDPVLILEKVNVKLVRELDSYHFVTLQLVAIDPVTGACEMSSAGHGPLTVNLSGQIQQIETKSGPPLGIAGISGLYHKNPFRMQQGDSLVMYTDGLSEEHSPAGEMFGTDRITDLMRQHSSNSARDLAEAMVSAAVSWRGEAEAHDDLTILTLKFKGTGMA